MAWDDTKSDGNVLEPDEWNAMVAVIKAIVSGISIPTAFDVDDATPSVAGNRHFKTANSGATSITTFDDGNNGQLIMIIADDDNTTITPGATLKCNAGSPLLLAQYDTIQFILHSTIWVCTGYQQNTA